MPAAGSVTATNSLRTAGKLGDFCAAANNPAPISQDVKTLLKFPRQKSYLTPLVSSMASHNSKLQSTK